MEMGSKQPQDKAVSGQQRSGGGDRGGHKEEKRNKTDSISAHGARPLTRPSLRRRSGLPGATLAPTRSGTPVDRIFGKSTFGTLCQLRPPARPPRSQPFLPRSQHAFCVLAEPPSPCSYGPEPSASGTRAERGAGLAPGLLDPLVECVGMLGELLAQLVILLLPALLLLQLQLPFLRTEGRQRPRQPPSRPLLHRQAQDGDSALENEAAGLTI